MSADSQPAINPMVHESDSTTAAITAAFDGDRGVYPVRRAAALAGIPRRTLHQWAQTGFYRPSISPLPHDYLWSWSDLLALRAIDWLRQRKDDPSLPRVPAQRIRAALQEIEREALPRHTVRDLVMSVDGKLFFQRDEDLVMRADTSRQLAMPSVLNLVSPYRQRGPDLLQPRPLLRILPGKMHDEPHVIHTRIATAVLYELFTEGYTPEQIGQMYPDVTPEALAQAVELEQSLTEAA
jgi:uncharacterized protein (DUF433 family)